MIDLYKTGRKSNFEKNVKYLTKKEVQELEVFVQHNKIVDVNGNLIDTRNNISIAEDGFESITNRAIFVMSEKGEIYISKFDKYGEFHHSSFLQGKKVTAAGEIFIENGIIKELNNNSGHYQPLLKNIKKNIIKELDNREYLTNNGLYGEKIEEAIKFLNF